MSLAQLYAACLIAIWERRVIKHCTRPQVYRGYVGHRLVVSPINPACTPKLSPQEVYYRLRVLRKCPRLFI